MKEPKPEEQWDKRKIVLFLIAALLLIGVGFQLKTMLLGESVVNTNPSSQNTNTNVKGASTKAEPPAPDIKQGIKDQISNLQSEAQNINLVDVASSSPQVQKVINDLKALRDYPKSQLKSSCEQICNGL